MPSSSKAVMDATKKRAEKLQAKGKPVDFTELPVILTTADEVETWMTAPADQALKLQRPLSDGALRIVARGIKEDPAGPTT
jgi:hypothetical protein